MGDGKKTSYAPTDGLSYDPLEEKYWDEGALAKEVSRVFEVCNGCRLCFKYCDTFPDLFRYIDDRHDGDVTALTAEETDHVLHECFQCKLCEVQCPYTPRDGHEFQLDFPKLVHRYEAVTTRKKGLPLRERVLGNPEGTAKAARASFGLANAMNGMAVHRWFLEKLLGIDRRKLLPQFAGSTFERWAREQGLIASAPGGEAVLFPTCYVNDCEPQLGRDTVYVLQRNQVDLRCAEGFACCGMPAWESGDLGGLQRRAAHNLRLLEPFVDAGAKVVAINPTCSMMMRREYPEVVAAEDRPRAHKVAEAVRDPSEMLWELRNEARFDPNVASRPERVAYHAPCHLRAQAKGFRGRDLIRKIGVPEVDFVAECCGHDGTHAMKTEGFEMSIRVGRRAFDGMAAGDAPVWSTDCPLAALQFEQHTGTKPLHPMTLLAKAYRGESFATSSPPAEIGAEAAADPPKES